MPQIQSNAPHQRREVRQNINISPMSPMSTGLQSHMANVALWILFHSNLLVCSEIHYLPQRIRLYR